MDKGFEQLGKMKGLLAQALGVANHSMKSSRSVDEAKQHIRQAINSVDKAAKSKLKKEQATETQFQTWWGTIQAGTVAAAAANMSAEASVKSLDQLNKMMKVEEDKLKELKELEDAQNQPPDQLLKD